VHYIQYLTAWPFTVTQALLMLIHSAYWRQTPHRPRATQRPTTTIALDNNLGSIGFARLFLSAVLDFQLPSQLPMASTSPQETDVPADGPSEAMEIPNTHLEPPQPIQTTPISSTSVEMSKLEHRPRSSSREGSRDITSIHNGEEVSTEHRNPAEISSALSPSILPPPEPSIFSPGENASHNTPPAEALLTRQFMTPAIGPSSDQPTPIPKEADSTGPTLVITLLLPTGARHPYRMDEKYLKKRNVNVPDNNPIRMSVYTLKELIWTEWREGTAAYIFRAHGFATVTCWCLIRGKTNVLTRYLLQSGNLDRPARVQSDSYTSANY